MPNEMTAQSYTIEAIRPQLDELGQVVGYNVQALVTYADATGSQRMVKNFDLWPIAGPAARAKVQEIQDLIKGYLDSVLLE